MKWVETNHTWKLEVKNGFFEIKERHHEQYFLYWHINGRVLVKDIVCYGTLQCAFNTAEFLIILFNLYV
jgi:hypothetical protein